MPQVFHKSANSFSRFTLMALVVLAIALGWLLYVLFRSTYYTQEGVARSQPVQFDHSHHVGAIGIDCRYCHSFVEDNAFAGIPPTQTCMNCHSQIWSGSPMLELVRESFRTGSPIPWVRVNNLPDFAYFDHSIHVRKGVACTTCHGQVDAMPMMAKGASLQMHWCLECHRHPEKFIAKELIQKNHIQGKTDCSTCHR